MTDLRGDDHPVTAWLRTTLDALCPEAVVGVHAVQGAGMLLIDVAPEEGAIGRVMGHQGATIEALRYLARRLGGRSVEVRIRVQTGELRGY